jgi:hypothetical protein
MSWICTMCGYENDEDASICVCGNRPDEFESSDNDDSSDIFIDIDEKKGNSSSILDKPPVEKPQAKKIQVKVPEKPSQPPKPVEAGDEVLVKEVEGWRFTYSGSENCMYLGTPALQSFRLKLTLQDLQELLDSMHEMTGVAKPKESVELQKKDILEMISIVDDMIEEKRSKFKIVFSEEELRSLSELINEKLND